MLLATYPAFTTSNLLLDSVDSFYPLAREERARRRAEGFIAGWYRDSSLDPELAQRLVAWLKAKGLSVPSKASVSTPPLHTCGY